MIKGIIFDFDDTLVNSDPLHIKSWRSLFNDHDRDFNKFPKTLRSTMLGKRTKENAKTYLDFFELNEDLEKILNKKNEIFTQLAEKELRLMPGAKRAINLLHKSGFKLALVSGSSKVYIIEILKRFNLLKFFITVIGGEDVQLGKPNPEGFIKAVEKLDVKPEECLVLEDATRGIEAAKAAGCFCFAVKNPNIYGQDFSEADKVLNSLNDLNKELISGILKDEQLF